MNTIDGQPPKSVETIVSGGNENEIAQAIYDNIGAGIEYFGRGGFEGIAIDKDGNQITIPFSRPSPRYIWVRFTRSDDAEQSKPTTYINDIKKATVAYNENLTTLGKDVIRNQQASPFYSVQGSILDLVEIAFTTLPTDSPIYTTIDTIPIANTELAEFDETRIFVEDT